MKPEAAAVQTQSHPLLLLLLRCLRQGVTDSDVMTWIHLATRAVEKQTGSQLWNRFGGKGVSVPVEAVRVHLVFPHTASVFFCLSF